MNFLWSLPRRHPFHNLSDMLKFSACSKHSFSVSCVHLFAKCSGVQKEVLWVHKEEESRRLGLQGSDKIM